MRNLLITLLAIGAIFAATSSSIAQAEPSYHVTAAAMTYPVSLENGDGLAPSVGHGFGVLLPIGNGWAYYNELGVSTSMGQFAPAFGLISGPSKKLTDHLALGASVLYKLIPDYESDSDPGHLLGVSVAPLILTGNGVNLSFPVSVARNFKVGANALAFTAKLSIPLP